MKIFHIGNPNSLNVINYVVDFSRMGHEIHTVGWGPLDYNVNDNVIHHNLGRSSSISHKKKGKTISKNAYIMKKKKKKGIIWLLLKIYSNIKIKKLVKKVDPDIIHGHEAYMNGPLTASFSDRPRIISCWGSDVHRIPWESKRKKRRIQKALRSVDAVHVATQDFGDFIIEKMGVSKDNIQVINLGIDFEHFDLKNIDQERLNNFKKEFNISEDETIILYPAGFRNWQLQNYINIVQAFIKVKDHPSNPRLVMLSYGATSGLETIVETIEKENLWDRVTIIDDYIPYDEMPYLLYFTDVFLILHDVDQLAVSIIESMLMGCVTILSDIKPYRSQFKDKMNCLFLDQKNVSDIEKTTLFALDNLNELKEKFKSNNIPCIKKEYNSEILNGELLEMYESMIEEH